MSDEAGPPYRVEFVVTTDDLVEYLRLAQKTLNTVGVVGGLLAAITGLLFAYFGDVALGAGGVVIGLIWLLFAGTTYVDRWRVGRQARSIIGTSAGFVLDASGIDVQGATGTGHVPWSTVTRVLESSTTVILKRDRLTLAWLPKRVLGSSAHPEEVLSFIRRAVLATGAHPTDA